MLFTPILAARLKTSKSGATKLCDEIAKIFHVIYSSLAAVWVEGKSIQTVVILCNCPFDDMLEIELVSYPELAQSAAQTSAAHSAGYFCGDDSRQKYNHTLQTTLRSENCEF